MIIRHNYAFITKVEGIFLYPGNNELTEEDGKRVIESQAGKDKLNCSPPALSIIGGQGVEISVPAKGAVKIAAVKQTISTMPVPAAVKVIKNTFNKELLLKYGLSDVRKGVQDAIKAQVAIIDEAGKDENPEDDPLKEEEE